MIAGLGAAVYFTRDEDNVAVDSQLAENFSRAVALAETESAAGSISRAWRVRVGRGPGGRARHAGGAISRRLGYAWTGDVPSQTGELLIFLRDGQVARFADYRGLGRFTGFATPIDALPRARAVLACATSSCHRLRRRAAFWARVRWRAFAFAWRLCWCGP